MYRGKKCRLLVLPVAMDTDVYMTVRRVNIIKLQFCLQLKSQDSFSSNSRNVNV